MYENSNLAESECFRDASLYKQAVFMCIVYESISVTKSIIQFSLIDLI